MEENKGRKIGNSERECEWIEYVEKFAFFACSFSQSIWLLRNAGNLFIFKYIFDTAIKSSEIVLSYPLLARVCVCCLLILYRWILRFWYLAVSTSALLFDWCCCYLMPLLWYHTPLHNNSFSLAWVSQQIEYCYVREQRQCVAAAVAAAMAAEPSVVLSLQLMALLSNENRIELPKYNL